MTMIFRIRMLSGEDETFIRDYEVSYATSLLDVHHFICRDLGYDPMNMASFFRSDARWERLQEFTSMDMNDPGGADDGAPVPMPVPMERATLGQVLHRNNDRLIYVFDPFGDRAMFLELTGSFKRPDGRQYPLTVFSQGDPPAQFDLPSHVPDSDTGLFDEAMDDYASFTGDDFDADDL
jgi:hypothetical protein